MGYDYKLGADASVRPSGKERYFRLERNLGAEYSKDSIRARLKGNSHRYNLLPVPQYRHPDFKVPKKLPWFARGSILALHRHQLYLIGYYNRHGNPATNARMHYLLRVEIQKLDEYIEDTKLLGREGIHSICQLDSCREQCRVDIDALLRERKDLSARLRITTEPGAASQIKDDPRYQIITRQLKKLRHEVKQCDRIEKRSRVMAERIGRIELDEDKKLNQGKAPQAKEHDAKHQRDRER